MSRWALENKVFLSVFEYISLNIYRKNIWKNIFKKNESKAVCPPQLYVHGITEVILKC